MIIIAVLAVLVFIFVFSIVKGVVFVASTDWAVENIVKIANIKKGEKVADLGSGNGKVLIELAKAGAEAHGYEINPFLVWWSKFRIKREGFEDKAFVHFKSFWDVDLSSFDSVVIFVVPYLMRRLEEKLQKELKPGAKVVCESFPFPNWEPVKKATSVYLYVK